MSSAANATGAGPPACRRLSRALPVPMRTGEVDADDAAVPAPPIPSPARLPVTGGCCIRKLRRALEVPAVGGGGSRGKEEAEEEEVTEAAGRAPGEGGKVKALLLLMLVGGAAMGGERESGGGGQAAVGAPAGECVGGGGPAAQPPLPVLLPLTGREAGGDVAGGHTAVNSEGKVAALLPRAGDVDGDAKGRRGRGNGASSLPSSSSSSPGKRHGAAAFAFGWGVCTVRDMSSLYV